MPDNEILLAEVMALRTIVINLAGVSGQAMSQEKIQDLDIYAQFVPESQRRAFAKMTAMVEARRSKPIAAASTAGISLSPQSRMLN